MLSLNAWDNTSRKTSVKISNLCLETSKQELKYTVDVDILDSNHKLWFSVEEKYADLVSNRMDSALLALLYPAMVVGEDIYVDGPISARLFNSLTNPVQVVLTTNFPDLKAVSITASEIEHDGKPASGVATGFSAGIDSFSALADYHYKKQSKGFQLTHLLYNNVGAHTKGGERLFKERYDRLVRTAEQKLNLPFIAVNSNLAFFYKNVSFTKTHSLRNASIAFLLQNGIGRFLYASAFHYRDIFVGPTKDIANIDPIIFPLLSTNSINLVSVGCEYTRPDKTVLVGNVEESYQSLDVCVSVSGDNNCSTCWKCKRTLLTMEIAGIIERYEKVFDLSAYRRVRSDYIAEVILSKEIFHKEIKDFAKDNSFRFPISSYLYAYSGLKYLVDLAKKISKMPKKLKRSILKRMNR
jgi:hypothetical protein